MKATLLVLAGLLAIASFLPLIRGDAWWIRIFDFPRLQIFVLGAVVLVAFVAIWGITTWVSWLVIGGLASALLLQVAHIYPYTPLAPKEVMVASRADPDSSIALLVANVLMDNRQSDRFLSLVHKTRPDVILMTEPDAWWEAQMRSLEDAYPYALKEPLDNQYGMLVYSRLPTVHPEIKYLVRAGIPSMHMQIRLPSGGTVWLHSVHPEPPSPTEADTSTPRDAELLIVGREVKERGTPTIVAGDLNDVAWSSTTTLFQKISGLLDPRKGRGAFNTYHAGIPVMRWPLDHVFHSKHFLLGRIERLPAFGSDHFPIYVRLFLQPSAAAVQEEPEPSREDQERAEAKIDKADGDAGGNRQA